jgi:hypothetical protein
LEWNKKGYAADSRERHGAGFLIVNAPIRMLARDQTQVHAQMIAQVCLWRSLFDASPFFRLKKLEQHTNMYRERTIFITHHKQCTII